MRRYRRTSPRPFWAAARSMAIPGWGQLAVRRRRAGLPLLAGSLLLAGAALAVAATAGPTELLALLGDPDVIGVLLGGNAVVAAVRMAATGHAWWVAGGRHVLVAAVLVGMVMAPHVAVAHVGLETRNALLTVFAAPEPTETTSTITTSTVVTTLSVATTSTSTASGPTVPEATSPTTLPTMTTTLPAGPVASRYNVLLLGGDAGPYRPGLRTDAVILVSVNLVDGDTAMFGLPRNYGGLALTDGRPLPNLILNEVYEWGRRHPEGFGRVDPGASAVVDVAQHLTGVEIDHFVLVDLTGFGAVVDAVGGMTITVPRRVYGPSYDAATGSYVMITIPRGEQTLDGPTALAYVRARYGSSDYDRMRRQRCVLSALAEELDPVSLLAGLSDLLAAIENHVTTDIPLDHVPGLIRLADRVDATEIRMLGFDHRWRAGYDAEGYAVPDVERIREAVRVTITDPEMAFNSFGARTAEGSCG